MGASCAKLGQFRALRSTDRLFTWTLRLCVQSKAPLRIAQLIGVYSGDLIWVGCSCLGACQISATCYYPTNSGTMRRLPHAASSMGAK